jgi:hypothetical protein
MVQELIDQVNSFVADGVLSPADGQCLIDIAKRIRGAINTAFA